MSRRLLITAGPTQEPVDAVRFLGNRSSGRLGVALAEHGADRGWDVTLLLGPTHTTPDHPSVELVRFRTTEDLRRLLEQRLPAADALVMAAAVADYRPIPPEGLSVDDLDAVKLRREGERLVITCEPTPDLLAGCAKAARPEQLLVGFALEPRDELLASATRKLEKKDVDLVVANPLETMDAGAIEATLVGPGGVVATTEGAIDKRAFASWLLERLSAHPKLAGDEASRDAARR
jgi:phosphopantothenoylcysteine decarboxylase / phosphopantothenate---cysteine ligase